MTMRSSSSEVSSPALQEKRISMQRSMFLLSAFTSAFATKFWIGGPLPLVEINISLLADQVGVATADTLDLGQGVHDLLLSLNIGVEQTQNELEGRLLSGDKRHDGRLFGGVVVDRVRCRCRWQPDKSSKAASNSAETVCP